MYRRSLEAAMPAMTMPGGATAAALASAMTTVALLLPVLCVLSSLPPGVGAASPAFDSITESALLDVKATLSSNIQALGLPDWGATWVPGAPCSTWSFTSCGAGGRLLALNLSSKALQGAIPSSFYLISTLTSLDLHNNRLYGPFNRDIAAINLNMTYLDLSSNFFTGPLPDVWPNQDIVQNDTDWTVSLYGKPIYINISDTFFTGFRTVIMNNPSTGDRPYVCIGIQTQGAATSACLTDVAGPFDGQTPGRCGRRAIPREFSECKVWCGMGTSAGICNSRLGAQCVPEFASPSDDTVVNHTCFYAPSPPGSPPPPPVPAFVNSADAAALKSIVLALGTPSSLRLLLSASAQRCSALFPRVLCDPQGNVIGLNLSRLALSATIPAALSSLPSLRSLSLAQNRLYGPFPFDLTSQLTNLVAMDLSSNYLTGPVPSNFNSLPTSLSLVSNYFSGDPAIRFGGDNVYCPAPGAYFLAYNCLTVYANSPCPGEPQRTRAACAAFCGIVTVPPSFGSPISGACGNGTSGLCVPQLSRAANPLKGLCRGSRAPPLPPAPRVPPLPPPAVPPPAAIPPPVYKFPLAAFAQDCMNHGTPASVFATWQPSASCATWSGLTCDSSGNLIAVDLRGKGIVCPFPGPDRVQDLFWSFSIYGSSVTYIDLSQNRFFGQLDLDMEVVTNLDYLDLSHNYLTGPLPKMSQGNFKYLDLSNNFFTGSPTVLGADGTTPLCPGSSFVGSFSNNCFSSAAVASSPCQPLPALRSAKSCAAFCSGAGSGRSACYRTPSKPDCMLGKKGFQCVKIDPL